MTTTRTSARRHRTPLASRSLGWAPYAAAAWAIAYAIGVRGYQGLGGTIGLSGTFEDPEQMRRASLIAGAGILLVGIGSLALAQPWGARLPRPLVIAPALAGSAYAAAHALTAYVTKPLHLLGVVQLRFDGWATRRQTPQFLWDLLFYEPWFLGLGILVTLGAVHHHRRTGGSERAGRLIIPTTAAMAVLLAAVACAQVIARS